MADTSLEKVVQGSNQFTTDLYRVLSENDGNVFFSPISAHAALSMAYQGAQETTAQQFRTSLHLPEAKETAEGYNSVMSRLNNVPNVTLHLANKIFLMDGAKMLPEFSNAITKHFLSQVQMVDFAKNEEAAKTINSWVEGKTNEKIKDLIQPDDLNDLTRLVLVNAIYFKGDWNHKFNPSKTKKEPFYLNDSDKVNVDMMHIHEYFNYKYVEDLDAQILEMPYSNTDLSMVIILPNKKNGIAELEKKLEFASLTQLLEGIYKVEVNVALPKFRVETTIDLEDALKKLGLGIIFDKEKANFKGMIELNPDDNLYVSKVVQKAFIEVNEEGAEAAAATGVVKAVLYSSKPQRIVPKQFKANHPFIYIVSDQKSHHLLVGRLFDPKGIEHKFKTAPPGGNCPCF